MELQAIKSKARFNAEQARKDGLPEFLIAAVIKKLERDNATAHRWVTITKLPPMATCSAAEIADKYVRDDRAVECARVVQGGQILYMVNRAAVNLAPGAEHFYNAG